MDEQTRAKLAEGITALVRAAMGHGFVAHSVGERTMIGTGSEVRGVRADCLHLADCPPLTARQTLGLRLLLGDTDPGLCAAAVDAMVEAGVLEASGVELVRQAERERAATVCDDFARTYARIYERTRSQIDLVRQWLADELGRAILDRSVFEQLTPAE